MSMTKRHFGDQIQNLPEEIEPDLDKALVDSLSFKLDQAAQDESVYGLITADEIQALQNIVAASRPIEKLIEVKLDRPF